MNISEINYILDKFYHKTVLIDLYQEYFRTWIEKGWVTTPFSANLEKKELSKIRKDQLVDILRQFYLQSDLCKKAYASFTPCVQKALFQAAWYQHVDIPTLEKECGIKIAQREKQHYSNSPVFNVLERPFRFFQYTGHYYDYWSWQYKHETTFSGSLYLPLELCNLLQNNLPKPANYDFHPVTSVQARHIYTASEHIASQAELYYTYVHEDNVKTNTKTGAILTSSVKAMQGYCQIEEFFPDDYTKTVNTLLLFAWCDPARSPAKTYTYTSSPELLKHALTDFLSDTHRFTLLRTFLPYLKGKFTYLSYEKNLGESIKKLLSHLPRDNSWITIENLLDYITFRKLDFAIVDAWSTERYLYVEKKGKGQGAYYLSEEDNGYRKYVLIPLIKALMFFLAATGVIDIAYNDPDISTNLVVLHLYDSLKAIRLTAFGQYVLGIKPSFEVTQQADTGTLVLDDNSLHITYTGNNKLVQLALEKTGTKISDTRYLVDFTSLFKECASIADVTRKIQLFKSKAPTPLPQNWDAFFRKALAQKNPLQKEDDYVVLKIKQDRTLIDFIATNEFMKQNIIKAEGYRVLVPRYKLSMIRSYLNQAGYFSEKENIKD